jgi:hypothetical protein
MRAFMCASGLRNKRLKVIAYATIMCRFTHLHENVMPRRTKHIALHHGLPIYTARAQPGVTSSPPTMDDDP